MKKIFKAFTLTVIAVITVVLTLSLISCTNENKDNKPQESVKEVSVQYVADGTAARTLLLNKEAGIDFAVVGEPAATVFSGQAALELNAKMNMQEEYKKANKSLVANYPQAGLFVKNSLAADQAFMTALFEALAASKEWVTANPASVTQFAKQNLYESAAFPANSIPNCSVNATALTEESKNEVLAFLNNVAGKDAKGNDIDWNGAKDKIFSAGNEPGTSPASCRFTAPEGTPALAIFRLPVDNTVIAGKEMTYEVVAPANIAAEMSSQKSDLVIMPVNAGANLIRQGAQYTLVSVAVDGSLYMVGRTEKGGAISFDDLNGKTIACIGKTGVPGLIFRYVMAKNGFTVKE